MFHSSRRSTSICLIAKCTGEEWMKSLTQVNEIPTPRRVQMEGVPSSAAIAVPIEDYAIVSINHGKVNIDDGLFLHYTCMECVLWCEQGHYKEARWARGLPIFWGTQLLTRSCDAFSFRGKGTVVVQKQEYMARDHPEACPDILASLEILAVKKTTCGVVVLKRNNFNPFLGVCLTKEEVHEGHI